MSTDRGRSFSVGQVTEFYAPDDEEPRRPTIDAGRLWAGGLATALVAALIAMAGMFVVHGLFGVSILAPRGSGVWGEASLGWYAFGAALFALAATALIHGLALFTPRPMRFFGWIVVLVTAVATLAPYAAAAPFSAAFATSVLNLILGIAIGSLVAGSARSATRAARLAQYRSG